MSEQEDLVQRLQLSQADFQNAVANLSDEQAEIVWSGTWGVKQIVAHIAGWQTTMAEALEKIGRGERPAVEGIDLTDTDGTNSLFAERARSQPFTEVLAALSNSAGRLAAAIRLVPDDRIGEGRTARRITETMIHHPNEHSEEIRVWRREQSV
jgi:hypothetical protein